MDPLTFDRITRLFASRRLSRRQAVTQATGLAAGALAASALPAAAVGAPAGPAPGPLPAHPPTQSAAPDTFAVLAPPSPAATAIATPTTTGAKPLTFLFLQSFERGSLVPKPGTPGHYLLTLEQGLGDTVYFSDRPAKVVGTVPTQHFLEALGFTPANPPNAALVGQRDATHKDIVVVELFDPTYDAAANTLTYEVTLLADWHKLDETFQQTPDDAQHLPRAFTAAHLFIDDCPDLPVTCCWYYRSADGLTDRCTQTFGQFGPFGFCWEWSSLSCRPCGQPDKAHWTQQCNATFPGCAGRCEGIF